MQKEKLLTVSGKPITIPIASRVSLGDYEAIISIAKARGKTVSSLTAELWKKEIEREKLNGTN